MSAAAVAVVVVTALVNAAVAVGDLVRAQFVLATAADVRVPTSWLPALGAAKMAGAAGLVLGLLGVRLIGIAAAVGLTLFFVCAIGRHVQTGVLRSTPFPGAFLLLAVASLLVLVDS
ncbi:DoxX family protein [Geodermatophilus sp. CPCC 206100]|uniref:DoxX family protein n=1 Tax=Geodermatophilus sp. CPCC 206100 TaxID=3020054 RepID=UPI003AFF776B